MAKIKIAQTQLAYIAGVIDGEGCFTLLPQNAQRDGYVVADVKITQGKTRLLYYIAALVGPENVSFHSRKRPRCTDMRFRCNSLLWLLPMLIPYLILKRDQAELMLEFLTIRHERGRGSRALTEGEKKERADMSDRMKALNSPATDDDGPYLIN